MDLIIDIIKLILENKFLRPMMIQSSIALLACFLMYLYFGQKHDEAMAGIIEVKAKQIEIKSELGEDVKDIKNTVNRLESRIDDLHRALIRR